MSSQYTLKITEERAREIPMVDLAFEVLKATNTPFYYRDLMQEIAKIKGLSGDEAMQVIAQLYTEINIDGRFACVGSNLWGLKRWYPVDKSEDAISGIKYPRIINDEDDLDDEEIIEPKGRDGFDGYGTEDEVEDFEEEEEEVEVFDEDEEEEEFDEEIDEEIEDEEVEEEDEEESDLDSFEEEEEEEDF